MCSCLVLLEGGEALCLYLFVGEDKLSANDYLLGHYAWPVQIQLDSAKVISRAPQTTSMVLELEVDGALTGHQITVPVGTVGERVQVTTTINHAIDAGQVARWKAVSGPVSAGDWGYETAVVMKKRSR